MIRMSSPCRSGTASAKIVGLATAWEEDKRGGGIDQLMPDSRTFTHIVFDLDHTLTFYPMTTAGVVAATFARLGLTLAEEVPVEDLASTYDKLWVSLERSAESADALRLAVWRRLLAERGLPDDNLAGRIAVEYGAIRRANGVQLFDGARQLLLDLRTAGYGLGLLTNGLSDVQWEKIRSLGLEASFDSILVAGDVGVFKPDSRVFAMLLDRLAALASRTLFVGDSYEMDVVGASAAGLETAWIRPLGAPLPGRVVPGFAFPNIQGLRGVVL
jgi:HAD superfamily hydrolase (TIGR01549 family)